MAYMKTGVVHETKRSTKVTIAVVLVVVLVILACVLFAVKNPRATRQLVMSDQDYASYVLMKNIEEDTETYRPYLNRLKGNTAYNVEGAGAVELSKDMKEAVGSEEVLETAQKYIQTLSFTGNVQARGLNFSSELKVNDKRQTIFTQEIAKLPSGTYSKVSEYGYGWSRMFGDSSNKSSADLRRERILQAVLSSDNEELQKSLTKAGKAAYSAVKKDIVVTIDEDKELTFQDKTATGERVNILIDQEDATTFLEVFFDRLQSDDDFMTAVNSVVDTDDSFGSEKAFTAFLSNVKAHYQNLFGDTEIKTVSVDLLVDEKNEIHAFDMLVKRGDGDMIVNAMLDDDEHRGPALHIRVGGNNMIKFNVEKTSSNTGVVDFELYQLKSSVNYSNLQLANGMVYGTFQFDPMAASEESGLGTFGLFLEVTPNVSTDGSTISSHILTQAGISTIGTATIDMDLSEAKYTGMLLEEDVIVEGNYTEKQKQNRRIQYWLSELPNADPLYKNALTQIVEIYIEEYAAAASALSAATDETLSAGATQ